ncbi:hypothetical protein ACVWWR_002517 [Bradyrhizobium sp. LM3.2]
MVCCRKISHSENADRTSNVLEVLLAGIIKHNIKFIAELSVGIIRHTNATGLRNRFETRCYVDTVAEYVPIILDNIANIDTDPELNSIVRWYVRIAFRHATLNIDRTAHCVHNAIELGQKAIAGVLDDVPAIGGNRWINQDPQMLPQPDVRAFLVHAR